ncbi:Tectonin beta-propeller repeat-containing protein 2 [Nymphon striatum]|nr:Tectonin beta-propeller repeat-containing protein 2 [Nymphon striatum]
MDESKNIIEDASNDEHSCSERNGMPLQSVYHDDDNENIDRYKSETFNSTASESSKSFPDFLENDDQLEEQSNAHQLASGDISACEQSSESSSINSDSVDFSSSLKDYGPMLNLMNLLPSKAQRGISTFPLKVNCLDAIETEIVVGCNIDTLFLYSRKSKNLRRLKCGSSDMENITAIKLISSIELMVAAGSSSGALIIFRIPVHPNNQAINGIMEKYHVQKLHKHQITCLKWSQNAMKLYSGDSSGLVTCTNIFYDNHGSSTAEILREDSSIVQLDYYQQLLLVSTTNRVFVCYVTENNRIMQVGAKPRKFPGNFGAQFYQSDLPLQRKHENIVFTCRPGLRIWKANASGVVSETILFKDAFSKNMATAKLLGTVNNHSKSMQSDLQFGLLLLYETKYLVTFTKNYIFIIDSTNSEIVGSFQSAHSIADICITNDEILVLQQSSVIIRLANKPEEVHHATNTVINNKSSLNPVQSGLKDFSTRLQEIKSQSNIFSDIKNSISKGERQLKNFKLPIDLSKVSSIDSSNLPMPRQFFQEYSANLLQKPENFKESKSKSRANSLETLILEEHKGEKVDLEPGDFEKTAKTKDLSCAFSSENEFEKNCPNVESFPVINQELVNTRFKLKSDAEMDPGELVYKPKKKKGKKKIRGVNTVFSLEIENDSSEADISRSVSSSELPALVDNSEKNTFVESDCTDQNPIKTTYNHINSKLESCKITESAAFNEMSKIEPAKEKLSDEASYQQPSQRERDEFLAQIFMSNIEKSTNEKELKNEANINTFPVITASSNISNPPKEESESPSERKENISCISDSSDIYTSIVDRSDSLEVEDEVDSCTHRDSKKCTENYDTDSKSNNDQTEYFVTTKKCGSSKFYLNDQQESEDYDELEELKPRFDVESKYCDNWMLHEGPGQLISLSISKRYIICVDNCENVFYSNLSEPGLSWNHLDYHANHVAVSESGNLVWRLYNSVVYAAKLGSCNPYKPVVSSWIEIMKNVSWFALDETSIWLIKMSGSLYLIKNIDTPNPTRLSVYSNAEHLKIKQVACQNDVVWALDSNHKIYYRSEINQINKQGKEWKLIESDLILEFVSISLCSNKTGWAIDNRGSVWFRNGVTSDLPVGVRDDWWEVNISGYIHRDSTTFDVFKNAMSQMYPEKLIAAFQSHEINVNLATGQNGVWFCSKDTKELWGNNSYVIGHRLEVFNLRSSFSGILLWNAVHVDSVKENEALFSSGSGSFQVLKWILASEDISSIRHDFVTALTDQIKLRFPKQSADIGTAFGVLGLRNLIFLSQEQQESHGDDKIQIIADFYGKEQRSKGIISQPLLQHGSIFPEWSLAKTVIKKEMYPRDNMLLLWQVVKKHHGETFPNLLKLVAIALVIPYQTADCLIWFIKKSDELFYIHMHSKKLHQISSPKTNDSIICVSPTPTSLWLLSNSGQIFIRSIFKPSYIIGNTWEKLPLNQIENLHIAHISCSSNVVWACDKSGNIYLRIGPLCPSVGTLPPAWIPIDGYKSVSSSSTKSLVPPPFKSKPETVKFSQVYVGPKSSMVWAIDIKMNIYVREGIVPDFDIGTDWVYVSGIQAQQLAISKYAVWALTSDGSIYRRFGISDSNCIGDYWKKMPGLLQHISVTADDEIWGLACGSVAVQHFAFQLQFEGKNRAESFDFKMLKTSESLDDNDWEVV